MLDNTLKKCSQLTINGVQYNTVKEACEDLGLNYGAVMTEKNRGKKTYEEVIEHKLKLNETRTIEINGVTYSSMHEACRENGLDYARIKCHWDRHNTNPDVTIAKYIELILNGDVSLDSSVTINGVKYSSISSACKTLGINSGSIYSLLRRHPELGLTMQEAIELELKGELDKIKEDVKTKRLNDRALERADKLKAIQNFRRSPREMHKFITTKRIGETPLKEFANKNGIDYASLFMFISNNNVKNIRSEDELINEFKKSPMNVDVAMDMARRNNIPYSKFKKFISATPNIARKSQEDIIEAYKIECETLNERVSKIKCMTPVQYKEAVEKKEQTGGNIWEFKGKKYLSLNDLCDDLGIDIKKLYRIRSGYPEIADETTRIVEFLLDEKEKELENKD